MDIGQPFRPRRRLASIVLAAPLAYVSTVSAANLAYEVTAGAGHTDNIARTADNEIEEDIAAAGLQFSLDQASARLQADLIGNLTYHEYLDDTYDSEVLGNFAGNALFDLVPERFQWMIADNFGQVLADPFQPATPDNRENINYFMTGPNVVLGLGSRTRLRLGARYSMTSYEDTPFDSDSTLGEIELGRTLSSASSISLNARAQQIEYDESLLNADYDQSEAFLRYDAAGARTFLTVDLGYTEIDREAATQSESGVLVRVDASRRVSPSSIMSLTLGREFSSSGAAFASTQTAGTVGVGAAPGRQTADPFTNEYVTLGWSYQRTRTGFELFGSRSEHSYDDRPLFDQTLTAVTAGIHRDLSTATRVQLDATYSKADFREPDSDYDEIAAGLTFSWRLSRSVSLGLTYDYFDRSSDVADGEYTENRYWLSLSYGRGEPRARVRRPDFAVDAVDPGM